MSAMWRVVCIGPGPMDRQRRVVDRGPLHAHKARTEAFANYLRKTGPYESVELVSSESPTGDAIAVKSHEHAPPPNPAAANPTLDELSKLFD